MCRLSKMVHLAPVPVTVTGEHTAGLFIVGVFRYHGLPETIVSDRDPRFIAAFWKTLFPLLGTRLQMSTADHPQTDGQTERVNRVLEDTLRSVCAAAPRTWSTQLPVVEFALSNAVHTSTGFTPFYLNGFRHTRVPLTLRGDTDSSILSGGEARKALSSQVSDVRPVSLRKQVESFMDTKLNIVSRVRDAMTAAQDKQKEYSDKQGRGNLSIFEVGDLVLLDTRNLPLDTVSSVGSNKLKHCFIGPFAVLARHGASYTIDLPKSMTTHPTFYVGRLKRYFDPQGVADSQTPLDPAPRSEGRSQSSTRASEQAPKPRSGRQGCGQDRTPEGLHTNGPRRHTPSTLSTPGTHHTRTSGSVPQAAPDVATKPRSVGSCERPRPDRTKRPGGPPAGAGSRPLAPPGPGDPQDERARPDSRPGRQHYRQSQGQVQSQARGDVDGGGQPQGPVSDPQSEHSNESGSREAPSTRTRTRAPPPLLDRNGEVHFHVERILQEQRCRGKRQLLVKWRGYAHSENSWEPIERLLIDCPKAVAIWEQKRRQLHK